MLGELNWIFTAITDTIAWNTLPRETFQKLFRQDLLVASLFRCNSSYLIILSQINVNYANSFNVQIRVVLDTDLEAGYH